MYMNFEFACFLGFVLRKYFCLISGSLCMCPDLVVLGYSCCHRCLQIPNVVSIFCYMGFGCFQIGMMLINVFSFYICWTSKKFHEKSKKKKRISSENSALDISFQESCICKVRLWWFVFGSCFEEKKVLTNLKKFCSLAQGRRSGK